MTATVSKHDRSVICDLASRVAEIAADPAQDELRSLWKKLNSLQRTRPLIRLYDWTTWANNPVVKFNYQCHDQALHCIEENLRTRIFHWEQRRDDTVFEPFYDCEPVLDTSGYGIRRAEESPDYDGWGAVAYRTCISDNDTPEMMNSPSFVVDQEASERFFQLRAELMGDILQVRKIGVHRSWCAPMDAFIQWRGIEQTFIDIVDRPEWVHRWQQAITDYDIGLLQQYEDAGMLSLNNAGDPLLTGGQYYTDELPRPGFDEDHVRLVDMWGCASTQIFSEVSPAMHEEFALQYEKQILDKFGLSYYGCCEPLHNKIDIILKNLPNVRKISISPWADVKVAAENLGNRAVFSYKPNPAMLGAEHFDLDAAEAQLRAAFDATRNCVVEVTIKDLHDVHGEAERMGAWTQMARRVSEEYA